MPIQTSHFARTLRANPIRRLTRLALKGNLISFAAGAPSAETFPQAELAQIAARVIQDTGATALQYGPTRGYGKLLEQIAAIMHKRGLANADPSQVLLTTGSQQGLDLVSRVLLDAGDVAIVELPSYIGGLIALHNAGAQFVGVPQDEHGLDPLALREAVRRVQSEGRRVRVIYTIPNFQNPSGVTISQQRREDLLAVAEEFDLLIIEDDPYYELSFRDDNRPLPLVALNPARVIYLSSFSKVLAPGLRTAWISAPAELIDQLEVAKEGADLSSSVLDQYIVADAVSNGVVEQQIPKIRNFYEVRCRAMLEALSQHAPEGTRWTRPLGGFFIVMEVAPNLDATALLEEAIERGVMYVPCQPFYIDGSGRNTLRLAYSKESVEKIYEGIELLCRTVRHAQLS